ncbi:AAA family ATPase [Rheinheimera baltica]|uniref:AAA family ATPase n=1 Tax=Rheinheimera baltica TaxID=67576 RepID=UPI00041640F1|nr:AAA family ATPase [Rheinheimera baltica]
MIINKVSISLFRGFKNVEFSLGDYITLIAGQNGTQKSTLLGILTQTFTIPPSGHPFSNEKPLTGGSFRSAFQDKFRLSPTLDLPGEHHWTLYLREKDFHPDTDEDGGFAIESIARKSLEQESIRFWQKGKRDAGSGYVQLPVIFLSLKRLIPIAEAGRVKEKDIQLSDKEIAWFSDSYNKILLISDNLESVDYLESSNKNTIGVTTDYYDWNSNSAGQDNLGRVLLAVISFQRLKSKYPKEYRGGILAIDEIDATLYPASQVKLLEFLSSVCSKSDIQIIASTHSLHLLEKICELKSSKGREKQFNTIYLTKVDGEVCAEESPSFEKITYNLNAAIGKKISVPRIPVYTEDKECIHFTKALLGQKFKGLDFPGITMGCGNLIQLGQKKVASFTSPNSIVVLDGDARDKVKGAKLKNYICLPGKINPEGMLANFLFELSDKSTFWEEKIAGYSKQVCFKDYALKEIRASRVKAKEWYNQQLESGAWGREARNAFNYLLESIPDEKTRFQDDFRKAYVMARPGG